MKIKQNLFTKVKEYIKKEGVYLIDALKAIRARNDIYKLKKYSSDYISKNLNRTTNIEPEDEQNILPQVNTEELKIPIVIDENFSRYLQKFMHSYRNKDNPTININNLLFLSGPEKSGKSWFLRANLKKFEEEEAEKKTMVIHYDMREIEGQNFYSFLYNFEREIINTMVERNKYEINKSKKGLVDIKVLKDLLFFRWEKGWIEINLAKAMRRAVNEEDNESPYTFYINKAKFRDEVLDLLSEYERKAFKQTVFVDKIDRLVEMVSESMGIEQLEAGLVLIQDCLIQREDYRKFNSNTISNTSVDTNNDMNSHINIHKGELYRDGLEVMEYFFDVLNYIAGYHENQLKVSELEDVDAKMTLYPHIVLAIEHIDALFHMKDAESRPMDYLHRIMLRLYNNSGYRNHFPIVLETHKNFYFDRVIYDKLWEMKYTFPSLVYLPTQFWNNIEKTLDKILNNYQKTYTIEMLRDSSICYYDSYVEAIKANDQTLGFPNTGKLIPSELTKFLYKINKLYVHPSMSLALDKGTIDSEVLDALTQWKKLFSKHYTPYIALRREVYDNEWLRQPITIAMLEENIIFYNKYFKRVHFEHFFHNHMNASALGFLYKKKINSLIQKLYFHVYFRPFKAFLFHIDYYTIGKYKYKFYYFKDGWDYQSKDWTYGSNLKWDVPDELYKGNQNQSLIMPTGQNYNNIY